MNKPILSIGICLSACLFEPTDEKPLTPLEQVPFLQAMLDSNGLKDVKAGDVTKALEPNDPHVREFYVALNEMDITHFKFTKDVQKLSHYTVIDLRDNEIDAIPEGLELKQWKKVLMAGNRLCTLTKADSTRLDAANVTWRGSQRCQ